MSSRRTAIDLFSGCGGLTLGLKRAGFSIIGAVDNDELAIETYKVNHRTVPVFRKDLYQLHPRELMDSLGLKSGQIDLLAGCPPCQGFSALRTLNGKNEVDDERKELVFSFLSFVRYLRPKTVMLENVPGLATDWRMEKVRQRLTRYGYQNEVRILDAAQFGVPQRRRRMILIASSVGNVEFHEPCLRKRTVLQSIGWLPRPGQSGDPLHDYRVDRAPYVMELIRKVPRDGGSRSDAPKRFQLDCHKRCDGFYDIYGRMRWNDQAPTITSGCINPSKGRFLHPQQNRAITLREAAILQGFPCRYYFSMRRGRYPVAEMIGNSFPPLFAMKHATRIYQQLR